jgi:hypothetical protein
MVGLLVVAPSAMAGAPLYPDLQTLPPRDLRTERTDVSIDGSGVMHNVLRFSNTVVNAGQGQLEITAAGLKNGVTSGPATQKIHDSTGAVVEQANVGTYTYHAAHQHWHYDDWGRYELWTKAAYDKWVSDGRPSTMAPDLVGAKTTSCVMDEEFIRTLPGTPWPAVHPSSGCYPDSNGDMRQGLSVGWGDTYDYYRQEQWIDLDQRTLADGDYVLRSVTDPLNRVLESAGGADDAREGVLANEGVVSFTISAGALVDTARPSGTVFINGVDPQTSTPQVTLRVLGRDDVSGVDTVRVSNDGITWKTYTYGGAGSTPMVINWDLTDAAYGGTTAGGIRTVYAQFRDKTGKWSASETDTIDYSAGGPPPGGGSSAYADAIATDAPVSYWRLGETSGTRAADARGANSGTFKGGIALGAASLLTSDPDTAATFDGVDDTVTADTETGLAPGSAFALEAWIKPASLPAAGAFASIATRPEAYSLQFNGPLLEWTIMPADKTRKRLQAPANTIQAGRTYHVVGSYDGTTSRLYVDGVQVASMALTTPAAAGSGFSIGSWMGFPGEFFKGTIDEVAYYDRALTGVQVKKHHDIGIATMAGVKAPTGLTATAATSTRIDVAWTDNSADETGFVLERSTSSTFTAPQAVNLPANATTYADVGRAEGTQYWYRIKAVTASDSSAWSPTATATTPAPTPTPTPTATPTPTPSATPTPTPTPSATPSPTPSATPSPSPSPTPSATPTPTPSATPTASPTPAPTYSSTVLADAPISYWRLDDASGTTAADARAANAGRYVNGAVLGQAPLTSQAGTKAIRLDGTNDHIAVANSSPLNFSTAFTLEAWIKPSFLPAAGSWASVVTKPEAYSLQFNGARLEFTVIQNATRRRLQASAGAVPVGSTTHVVATYDGKTQRLYLNGVQVASRAQTGSASATTYGLFIGSWGGWGEYFGGTVDDVAVYAKTLTAARVQAHFDAGRPAGLSSVRSRKTRPRKRTRPAQYRTRGKGVVRHRFAGARMSALCDISDRPGKQ